eukprot:COSAG01_NODE_20_length_38868_cov_34.606071_24_plen_121_part_00
MLWCTMPTHIGYWAPQLEVADTISFGPHVLVRRVYVEVLKKKKKKGRGGRERRGSSGAAWPARPTRPAGLHDARCSAPQPLAAAGYRHPQGQPSKAAALRSRGSRSYDLATPVPWLAPAW